MIQAQDLRIGNLIEYDGKQFPIHSLPPLGDDEYEQLHPIPLTSEILLKCGFIEDDGIWVMKIGLKLYYDGTGFYHINSEMLTHLDYLHQLQNWYYFNINEELTFTP